MEIQVNKLRELMDVLKPAVLKKSVLPVTTYIRLGEGKAVATDLETMVIADLPKAQEPMLLPFGSIAEMLKYVTGNATLKIEVKGKTVSLAWDGGTASYPTEAVQDFPILPEIPARAEGMIDGDTLIPAMLAALPYAAIETTRPVLNGVTLVLGSPIEVAAGDGFRMSHQVLGLTFPLEEKAIVPARSVAILGHVFTKTPRTPPTAASLIPIITAKRQLHMALIGDNKVRLDFGQSASVVINLIQGNPPEWLQLIPRGEPILQSHLFAPQLEAAVKRVRDIARDGSGIVRMAFADAKLTISAVGEEQEIRATLDVISTQGEPGRTALNYTYLLRYLSGKLGIITISQYDATGPVVFEYQNSPRVLIMPMAVQWGDEQATAEENPKVEPEEEAEASHEEQADERVRALDVEGGVAQVEQEASEGTPEPEEKTVVVASATKSAGSRRRRKATT